MILMLLLQSISRTVDSDLLISGAQILCVGTPKTASRDNHLLFLAPMKNLCSETASHRLKSVLPCAFSPISPSRQYIGLFEAHSINDKALFVPKIKRWSRPQKHQDPPPNSHKILGRPSAKRELTAMKTTRESHLDTASRVPTVEDSKSNASFQNKD